MFKWLEQIAYSIWIHKHICNATNTIGIRLPPPPQNLQPFTPRIQPCISMTRERQSRQFKHIYQSNWDLSYLYYRPPNAKTTNIPHKFSDFSLNVISNARDTNVIKWLNEPPIWGLNSNIYIYVIRRMFFPLKIFIEIFWISKS